MLGVRTHQRHNKLCTQTHARKPNGSWARRECWSQVQLSWIDLPGHQRQGWGRVKYRSVRATIKYICKKVPYARTAKSKLSSHTWRRGKWKDPSYQARIDSYMLKREIIMSLKVYYAFGCLGEWYPNGGEEVCRRDRLAAAAMFKYLRKPVIHRQTNSPTWWIFTSKFCQWSPSLSTSTACECTFTSAIQLNFSNTQTPIHVRIRISS